MRTHCCRHKCFPVCPRAQHLLRTQILCPGHKNVSDFVQKHFVSATNVSQFAQPKKHHGQQCVRNNVSSFTRALSESTGYFRQVQHSSKINTGSPKRIRGCVALSLRAGSVVWVPARTGKAGVFSPALGCGSPSKQVSLQTNSIMYQTFWA